MNKINFSELGFSRSQVEYLIDEWIFSERDRAIVKRRYLDGIKYEQLAYEFQMSVRQVKDIIYHYNERFDAHFLCPKVAQNKHSEFIQGNVQIAKM